MKNTISTIAVYDLAERIGNLSTNEEAEKFRSLAIQMGFGDVRCSDIPDHIWVKMIAEVVAQ